jgi:hypothetical protein
VLRGRILTLLALAALLAGCATSINNLSPDEIATLNVQGIDVRFAPHAHIWWGNAEREYAAKVGAPPPQEQSSAPKTLPGDSDTDAYREMMDSPAAKAYVRDKLAGMIKDRLQRDVVPKFQGTRNARIEIEVHSFFIPSPLQRIALGGGPFLRAITVLRDPETGAELGKLNAGGAGYAGNGLIGVLVDQGFSDLEDRVLDNYAEHVLDWLTGS